MKEFLKALNNFQPTLPAKIEFRVYYDASTGKILDYTTDQREGDFIIVDRNSFHAHRFDYRVKDGKLIAPSLTRGKLRPGIEGTRCHPQDVSLVVDSDTNGICWSLYTYE